MACSASEKEACVPTPSPHQEEEECTEDNECMICEDAIARKKCTLCQYQMCGRCYSAVAAIQGTLAVACPHCQQPYIQDLAGVAPTDDDLSAELALQLHLSELNRASESASPSRRSRRRERRTDQSLLLPPSVVNSTVVNPAPTNRRARRMERTQAATGETETQEKPDCCGCFNFWQRPLRPSPPESVADGADLSAPLPGSSVRIRRNAQGHPGYKLSNRRANDVDELQITEVVSPELLSLLPVGSLVTHVNGVPIQSFNHYRQVAGRLADFQLQIVHPATLPTPETDGDTQPMTADQPSFHSFS